MINVQGYDHYERCIDGGRGEFADRIKSGEYKNKSLLIFNAGEAELSPYLSYYDIGNLVGHYTEITGCTREDGQSDHFDPHPYNVEIVSWPYYWLMKSVTSVFTEGEEIRHGMLEELSGANAPRSLYTCMMRQPKPMRKMLFDVLEKESLLPDGIVTCAWKGLSIDLKEQLPEDGKWFPNSGWELVQQTHRFPPWYTNCLIDIIPETHYDKLFYTEKTWKAILGRRVPLICGARRSNHALADMGFKTPEWLDVYWDGEHHEYDRVLGLGETLKTLRETGGTDPVHIRGAWAGWKKMSIDNQIHALEILLEYGKPPHNDPNILKEYTFAVEISEYLMDYFYALYEKI